MIGGAYGTDGFRRGSWIGAHTALEEGHLRRRRLCVGSLARFVARLAAMMEGTGELGARAGERASVRTREWVCGCVGASVGARNRRWTNGTERKGTGESRSQCNSKQKSGSLWAAVQYSVECADYVMGR